MKNRIDVTLYSAGKEPQGTDGAVDLAQAKQGFTVATRVRRDGETRALHLTLDEALELSDALDMLRERCYGFADQRQARSAETPSKREWMTQKWDELANVMRRRAGLL